MKFGDEKLKRYYRCVLDPLINKDIDVIKAVHNIEMINDFYNAAHWVSWIEIWAERIYQKCVR